MWKIGPHEHPAVTSNRRTVTTIVTSHQYIVDNVDIDLTQYLDIEPFGLHPKGAKISLFVSQLNDDTNFQHGPYKSMDHH